MAQLVFAYFPIVLLIYLMTKKNSMPSYKALPLTAAVVYLVVMFVFNQSARHVHAVVIEGLLLAWTPITIIAGAILLFRTMEATGALDTIKQWLNSVSSNSIAQLMIVGWAFQFLIEGASGFGTPAAIAAPVLVGLGFAPVRVAIFCLILNSVPVSFGAVGTPTWFGLSVVDLSAAEIARIGMITSVLNSIAALPVVLIALLFITSKEHIKRNLGFIVLSVLACVLPYMAIAMVSYEFPALLGGLVGLIFCIVFAKLGWGLDKRPSENAEPLASAPIKISELVKASFPLWGVVLLLIITRVPQLGIKPLLQLVDPALALPLGELGTASISVALVLSLQNILGTAETWSHSLLYVPSIIPFVVISAITFFLFPKGSFKEVSHATVKQMKLPVFALLGALVFVNLMMMGGQSSVVTLIGKNLANITGENWTFFSPFLGALGSFFSGSATISNLTFGAIQNSIATDLSLDAGLILAMQSAGAAMGNMVCINNIVAVASVLALGDQEGYILKRTVWAMLAYGLVVGLVGVLFVLVLPF